MQRRFPRCAPNLIEGCDEDAQNLDLVGAVKRRRWTEGSSLRRKLLSDLRERRSA
jgi:hypothetical protein